MNQFYTEVGFNFFWLFEIKYYKDDKDGWIRFYKPFKYYRETIKVIDFKFKLI